MIQVDMFEVGLGSALCLQFKTASGTVRVLADAGVDRGFNQDHVKAPLEAAIAGFAEGLKRIDLIIGTHYDADHLKGLVPIINDVSIAIGEAWLPPVANDVRKRAGVKPRDQDLLALQFANPEIGDTVLIEYLRAHAANIQYIRGRTKELIEQGSLELLRESRFASAWLTHSAEVTDEALLDLEGFFEQVERETEEIVGEPAGHVDQDLDTLERDISYESLARFRRMQHFPYGEPKDVSAALELIVKSSAKKAITAKWLAAVVNALTARRIAIRCAIIEDGEPRRFIWNAAERRFEPNAQTPSAGPILTLLGPSKSLVNKQWEKLPLGDYLARTSLGLATPEPITESNQLSYVALFEQDAQRLLVCGDAGFVDFKPEGRGTSFYPKLLACLTPLHIVQVAHHAGYNKFFYFGLVDAGYATQTEPSFLLLSHAEHDATRPNEQFGRFIEIVRSADRELSLLFTSEPLEPHVRDFKALVAPVVGSAHAKRGDVQLFYDADGWRVTKHAVQA